MCKIPSYQHRSVRWTTNARVSHEMRKRLHRSAEVMTLLAYKIGHAKMGQGQLNGRCVPVIYDSNWEQQCGPEVLTKSKLPSHSCHWWRRDSGVCEIKDALSASGNLVSYTQSNAVCRKFPSFHIPHHIHACPRPATGMMQGVDHIGHDHIGHSNIGHRQRTCGHRRMQCTHVHTQCTHEAQKSLWPT